MSSSSRSPAFRDSRAAGALGWTAFVLALVGFLLGWVPILGLVLGATATVLSIVALIQGRPTWMGLLGVIMGALATVTGLVVTIGLIALLNLPPA